MDYWTSPQLTYVNKENLYKKYLNIYKTYKTLNKLYFKILNS